MHGIVVLLATVFFIGIENQPQALTDTFSIDSYAQPNVERAVEVQACEDEKAKMQVILSKNPKVRGWEIVCHYVPIKDKV